MDKETEEAIKKIANFLDTIKRLYIVAFILGLSLFLIIGIPLLSKFMRWG